MERFFNEIKNPALDFRDRNVGPRHARSTSLFINKNSSLNWPIKRIADIEGDIVIGGLHMVHEREDQLICGPVMPQGSK